MQTANVAKETMYDVASFDAFVLKPCYLLVGCLVSSNTVLAPVARHKRYRLQRQLAFGRWDLFSSPPVRLVRQSIYIRVNHEVR